MTFKTLGMFPFFVKNHVSFPGNKIRRARNCKRFKRTYPSSKSQAQAFSSLRNFCPSFSVFFANRSVQLIKWSSRGAREHVMYRNSSRFFALRTHKSFENSATTQCFQNENHPLSKVAQKTKIRSNHTRESRPNGWDRRLSSTLDPSRVPWDEMSFAFLGLLKKRGARECFAVALE